jgi:hypothetical protein
MYKGNNGDKENLLIDKVFNEAVAEVLKDLTFSKKHNFKMFCGLDVV